MATLHGTAGGACSAQITEACDEDTIGIAAILGTTYTGHFDDVATIDTAVGAPLRRACQAQAAQGHCEADGGPNVLDGLVELHSMQRSMRMDLQCTASHNYGFASRQQLSYFPL
jgi:hypothetical protein